MVTLTDVMAAKRVLNNVAIKTPLIKSNIYTGCNLYLKLENMQITGSFKLRGAYNKISKLTEIEKARGVVACSAGNHAQGVAYACKKLGIKATICVPANAPKIKVEATKSYGANVVLVEGGYDDAYQKALELQKKYHYTFIHPFNDDDVIAGQGTIAVEILEQLPNTDVILVPVGGGGLISGIAVAAKSINPNIRVYGVQSTASYAMFESFAEGYPKLINKPHTIADGTAVRQVGNLTLKYTKKYVNDIFVVSEKYIAKTIKLLLGIEKVVVEGAGALPLAAVLQYEFSKKQKNLNVVCVLSGGNIDFDVLAEIISDNKDK